MVPDFISVKSVPGRTQTIIHVRGTQSRHRAMTCDEFRQGNQDKERKWLVQSMCDRLKPRTAWLDHCSMPLLSEKKNNFSNNKKILEMPWETISWELL